MVEAPPRLAVTLSSVVATGMRIAATERRIRSPSSADVRRAGTGKEPQELLAAGADEDVTLSQRDPGQRATSRSTRSPDEVTVVVVDRLEVVQVEREDPHRGLSPRVARAHSSWSGCGRIGGSRCRRGGRWRPAAGTVVGQHVVQSHWIGAAKSAAARRLRAGATSKARIATPTGAERNRRGWTTTRAGGSPAASR